MIRVNLLPIKEARRRSAGRIQLLIFTVVLVLEAAVLVFLFLAQQNKNEEIAGKVAKAQKKVNKLEKEVEEAKDYEKKMKKLRKKLSVLDRIKNKSIGPVHVLEELQTILSPPQNVQERYAQRKMNWNVEWNPRHLWIESLAENEGNFQMTGQAVDADDVAEFLHRLETASHFHNVQLDFVRPASDNRAGSSGSVVNFRITGKLTYTTKKDNGKKGS